MLQGAFNFRDLGGLPLGGGRYTQAGRLFRSDTLQALTAADVRRLLGPLGVRTVVDLRATREVQEEGRGLLGHQAQVRFVGCPLEMARSQGIPPGQVLDTLYGECLDSPSLPRAVAAIAAGAERPVLFHCAAGKDRTGIVAAMVLGLAGVGDDAIVADYLASAEAMPRMIERFLSWPRYRDHLAAMPAEVYAVEAGPIRRLLSIVHGRHGGFHGWAMANGLEPGPLVRLRERLAGSP